MIILRAKALEALNTITFIPANSKNFLKATTQGRLEWCVSRQRIWGVPIVAVSCKQCQTSITSSELIERVAQGIALHGIDFWDSVNLQEILPDNFCCKVCRATEFAKERDILDVWFDSGVSHYSVVAAHKGLQFPADMYVEGLDQHRGWFQSSLLTSIVLHQQAPMKAILTHGFTVDAKGHKMSKSLGNVVAPDDIIKQLGTDGLRLWASSIAPGADAVVTPVLLENIQQVYRKIRNTARFLLANLYDFSSAEQSVPDHKLLALDYYALQELAILNQSVQQSYAAYDITAVFHQLADYCTVQLSSLYLDIIKDRLYTAGANSFERRSAQTVCFAILDSLTRLMAPIMSFTAEDISDHYASGKQCSIHLEPFVEAAQIAEEHNPTANMLLLKTIRSVGLKALEALRQDGTIKHSLEASLHLYYSPQDNQQALWKNIVHDISQRGQCLEDFFKEFFIVSQCSWDTQATASTSLVGLSIQASKAQGVKCPRCWHYTPSSHHDGLCQRCEQTLI